MFADIGLDPNITLSGILVCIPATIAAWASYKSVKQGRAIQMQGQALHEEIASPNGTTTAQAVQDIKAGLATVAANQAAHELADVERFRVIHQRIDALDTSEAITVRHVVSAEEK